MPAPLLPIAVSLIAEIVPDLLRLFKNDKAADVAESVGDIAKKITGQGDVSEASEMIKADPSLAVQFKQAVMDNEYRLAQLVADRERTFVEDVADARKYKDDKTFWLGVAVLVTFAISIVLVLYGAFSVMTAATQIDPNLFAAIAATIGTLIGYVAANAQQVVNYFFGSSQGSAKKTDDLAEAIRTFKGK